MQPPFVRHYTHAGEDDIQAALKFGSIGSPFKIAETPAAQEEHDMTPDARLPKNATEDAKANPGLPKKMELPEPEQPSVPANREV